MRIHLGHHFYGAGNLGDDFMLAGFLAAMRTLAPTATFTCCVPFPLDPLRRRFPAITWLPCDQPTRARCIAECAAWLGLGGSPFQSALSRWFVDHLVSEAALCARAHKPMYFLGVGVQTSAELADPDVQRICAQAAAIWTRDVASAERLAALPSPPPIASAADLAHLFFRETPPPAASAGRLTLVANFDYGAWPGQAAFLSAAQASVPGLAITERVWLAQESRELPGAERALHRALPLAEQARWSLTIPDLLPSPAESLATTESPTSAESLTTALSRWPSGEWLVTARFHAALAGAWAGSKIAILATNEKLRAAAHELACPLLATDADAATVTRTLQSLSSQAGVSSAALHLAADRAFEACAAFVRAAARSAVAPSP